MPLPGRFTALVIHGDGGVLDVLTRWFEASGFEVVTALNAFRAQAALESERGVEVVIVPWDDKQPVGGEVYRWVLKNRPDLRTRFVFIADDVPAEFDAIVGGRCLAVPLAATEEIVRVATGVVRRVRTPPRGVPVVRGPGRPPLLLADDDPMLLVVMAELLTQAGYAVSQVDSMKAAIELAEFRDFDVIVIDWRMHDGTGLDLYKWISTHKTHLASRVVFLSETDQDDVAAAAGAPGRPMFRKGQDSQGFIDVLREIVASVRGNG
jgi:DNA-binding response OmpR family regulator